MYYWDLFFLKKNTFSHKYFHVYPSFIKISICYYIITIKALEHAQTNMILKRLLILEKPKFSLGIKEAHFKCS